jgi:hypothetical protein
MIGEASIYNKSIIKYDLVASSDNVVLIGMGVSLIHKIFGHKINVIDNFNTDSLIRAQFIQNLETKLSF